MNNKYITPLRLWSEYSPDGELNVREVNDKPAPVENARIKEVYYCGGSSDVGEVRVFARLLYTSGKKPCVLVLRAAGATLSLDDYHFYLDEGYHVLVVDYCGQSEGRGTLYPESLSFAQYQAGIKDTLTLAPNGAESSPWYIWAKAAMRGVSYLLSLPECNGNIFVHGEREGGAIGWILAAMDSRISRAAILFEAGYFQNRQDTSEAYSIYSALLSPQAYVQMVKCPLLLIMASNDSTAFERVFESVKRIPEGIPAYLSIAPRQRGQITSKNLATLKLFAKECVEGKSLMPIRPSIEAQASQGKLYYNITVGGEDVKKVRLYFSSSKDVAYRCWEKIEAQNAGEGEYLARAGVTSEETVYAFANVEYSDEVVLSTAILARKPLDMGVRATQVDTIKLIYDSSMLVDSFVSEGSTLVNEGVLLAQGPFGIRGIGGKNGDLFTYKTTMPRYQADSTASLMTSFYTPQSATIYIVAEEKTAQGTRVFRAAKEALGGEFWQKLTYARSDFRTAEGAILPSWENVVKLSFVSGILFNNIAWV